MESELFVMKRSLYDAKHSVLLSWNIANGWTLFLDEIERACYG